MCVYFCIGFIDFMLKFTSLLYYTNLLTNFKLNLQILIMRRITK